MLENSHGEEESRSPQTARHNPEQIPELPAGHPAKGFLRSHAVQLMLGGTGLMALGWLVSLLPGVDCPMQLRNSREAFEQGLEEEAIRGFETITKSSGCTKNKLLLALAYNDIARVWERRADRDSSRDAELGQRQYTIADRFYRRATEISEYQDSEPVRWAESVSRRAWVVSNLPRQPSTERAELLNSLQTAIPLLDGVARSLAEQRRTALRLVPPQQMPQVAQASPAAPTGQQEAQPSMTPRHGAPKGDHAQPPSREPNLSPLKTSIPSDPGSPKVQESIRLELQCGAESQAVSIRLPDGTYLVMICSAKDTRVRQRSRGNGFPSRRHPDAYVVSANFETVTRPERPSP